MATEHMSTRSKTKLTEEELEALANRIKEKEQQLRDQADALKAQQENFEWYQKLVRHRNEQTEMSLRERSLELSRNRTCSLTRGQMSRDEIKSAPSASPETIGYSPPPVEESPCVSFREALEVVPYFDGNNITLSEFARSCRRAREIIPPSSERNLTRLLVNKLRGRAYFAVEDEPCDTITQLLDLLDASFGSIKTIDQCKGELSTTFMKPNEHILDYIIRVKDLRYAILDRERREKGILDDKTIENIDGLTARSFCEGLPSDYRCWLRQEHYHKPFEAFSFAKTLAKRHKLDEAHERTSRGAETKYSRNNVNIIERPVAHSALVKPAPGNYYRPPNGARPFCRIYDQIRGPRAWPSDNPQSPRQTPSRGDYE